VSTPVPATAAARDLSELVGAVFERWRAEGVAFLVLRNYEGLPRETGNDIDLLVLPEQLAKAERLLVSAAQQAGYHLHNRAEFSPVVLFFHNPSSRWQVQFDLYCSLKWRSLPLLCARTVLAQRLDRGLFAVPHPVHEAVNSLLTRLIFHGYVKQDYRPIILAGVKQDPVEATTIMAEMFGEKVACKLTGGILAERWSEVESLAGAIRRQLIWRRLTRQPLAMSVSLWHDLGRFARRLWRPPGMTIVLLGADGCGKSTVATRLTDALRHTFAPDKGLVVHWKPSVFLRRRRAERPPTTDPHGRAPRGRVASAAMLVYHFLEYLVGACLQFVPVLFRNGLVLVDRYYYDFSVDPRRYRLRSFGTLFGALFRLLPSPDLVFLLDAPPEVLRSRKQEVPEEETRRQREAYRKLAASLPCARTIDCAQALEAVVKDITSEVLRYLEARQERRLKR